MARADLDALRRAISLPDLITRYGVDLRNGAKGLEGLCPFHKERTPSFTVFTGADGKERFQCFGCGAKGDHVQFIQDYDNLTTGDAIRRLQEIVGGALPANDNRPAQRQATTPARSTWNIIPAPEEPAPATLRVNRDGQWGDAPVVGAWAYRDRTGQLWGYACRVEFRKPDGDMGKDVIPVTYRANTDTGEVKWRQGSLPEPRILYGAELLDAHPEAQVVIVEGEKAADAARRLLAGTGLLVLTWPGGCKAVERADWSMLAGRKIVGWPDCDSKVDKRNGDRVFAYQDQPGMRAMLRIAELVAEHGAAMRIIAVPLPGVLPDGWDAADAEAEHWTRERVLGFIKESMRTPDQIQAMPASDPDETRYDDDGHDERPEPPPYTDEEVPHHHEQDHVEPAQAPATPPAKPPAARRDPFRILGWDRETGYYLPDGFTQVVALPATAHSKLNLMQLAPMGYWMGNFPSEKRSGDKIDWTLAAESLMRRAQATGVYDPEDVRGRGAWWEDGRWAVHLGDRVIIDGTEHDLREAPTRYVYEAAKPIPMAVDNPLKASEAIHLVEICEALRWERPIYGKLLAGWVFLAPVCGALSWRPHIWITGAAGSGKSTAMTDIIGRCLRGLAIETEGDTSEAGLRQRLQQDALPVVFDEFESERKKSADNVENVLAMVTRASSNSNASLLKGGQDGKSAAFKTRAMFCFSSIGVNMKQHAARTRVTVMSLYTAPETEESLAQYNGMMARIFETLTDDYIARMQARAVHLLPVIRKNAKVFAEAAAVVLKDRRMGDQIGTLLAGAFALHSNNETTREFAQQWIEKQAWDEVTEVAEAKDEASCLAYILSYQLRVETQTGVKSRTIGELIQTAAYIVHDHDVATADAVDILRRHGILVAQGRLGYTVSFANSYPALERVLADTAWQKSYGRTLKRLPGAEQHLPKKYGATSHRGVEFDIGKIV